MKKIIGITILLLIVTLDLSAKSKLLKTLSTNKKDFLQSCQNGDVQACKEEGDKYYFAEDGYENDYKKAGEYYKLACDGKVYQGCAYLAGFYNTGRIEIENAKEEAFRLNKMVCNKGDGKAMGRNYGTCSNVGLSYKFGSGVKQDFEKAVEYFKKACNKLPGGEACKQLNESQFALENESKINSKPSYMVKAIKLLKDECDNKHKATSCRILSAFYERGTGVEKNIDIAKEYNEKWVEHGKKGCFDGVLDNCANLVFVFEEKKDIKNAIKYAMEASNLGSSSTLTVVAEMYHNGVGTEENIEKENEFYRKAVEGYRKECDNKNASSCSSLGLLYSYGTGVSKSEEMYVAFRAKACEYGYGFACVTDEGMQRANKKKCNDGDISTCEEIDPKKAKELYKQKCDNNDGESCYDYARMIKFGH